MRSIGNTDASGLDVLHSGFDGCAPPASGTDPLAQLWRIGRWLRIQGARRPMSLRVIRDGTAMVDGRILIVDEFGGVQDLSTTRRTTRPSSAGVGAGADEARPGDSPPLWRKMRTDVDAGSAR